MCFRERAANRRWLGYAKAMGFSGEKEMLTCLYREWSTQAIADLIGIDRITVTDRLRKHGIKIRPRGGRNNVGR